MDIIQIIPLSYNIDRIRLGIYGGTLIGAIAGINLSDSDNFSKTVINISQGTVYGSLAGGILAIYPEIASVLCGYSVFKYTTYCLNNIWGNTVISNVPIVKSLRNDTYNLGKYSNGFHESVLD